MKPLSSEEMFEGIDDVGDNLDLFQEVIQSLYTIATKSGKVSTTLKNKYKQALEMIEEYKWGLKILDEETEMTSNTTH